MQLPHGPAASQQHHVPQLCHGRLLQTPRLLSLLLHPERRFEINFLTQESGRLSASRPQLGGTRLQQRDVTHTGRTVFSRAGKTRPACVKRFRTVRKIFFWSQGNFFGSLSDVLESESGYVDLQTTVANSTQIAFHHVFHTLQMQKSDLQ